MIACWSLVHLPLAGLLLKTLKPRAAVWSSQRGTGQKFDTLGSWEEHPRPVQNAHPLTSHRILTHFWENSRYPIQACITHINTGVWLCLGYLSPVDLRMRKSRVADRGSSNFANILLVGRRRMYWHQRSAGPKQSTTTNPAWWSLIKLLYTQPNTHRMESISLWAWSSILKRA